MALDLTDNDKAALTETIERDRFPLSRGVKRLRAILAKLGPSAPRLEPSPTPKPPGERSVVLAKRRRQ